MKIKSITLQNYKQFIEPKTISFCNPEGKINNKTILVGNNGAGKTTVLQAIVMLVASATREGFTPESLDTEWEGFSYRLLGRNAQTPTANVEIVFSDEEIDTTIQYAKRLYQDTDPNFDFNQLKAHKNVSLSLSYNHNRVGAGAYFELMLFYAHKLANTLADKAINKQKLFNVIGNIYWYDEQRSWQSYIENSDKDLDSVRNFLANTYNYHMGVKRGEIAIGAGEFDFYAKLEDLYKKVFPNRAFEGARPRFDIFEKAKAPDFFLSCNGKQYELAEMSAGERAIFPILMDFARWNINNSIIIIDEIELHLHPPLQQGLVRVLEKLGNNNQFILTTHSNNVGVFFKETENQIIFL